MIDFIPKGTFSWEKPIEQEILEFARHMASQMERIAVEHTDKKMREGCENMARAYRTIERHILHEIEFRKSIEK